MAGNKLSQQIGSLFNNENAYKIFLNLIVGIIVVGILIFVKLYIETTSLGHKFEVATYEFLNTQIPSFSPEIEMPVVVVDISEIPGGKPGQPTSRKILREIISELVNQKARAIAVDIDFSPNDMGWIDSKDPEFFEECLDYRRNGVPVLLGVGRTADEKPENWLGSEDFKDLAAFILIDITDTSRMPVWIQNEKEEKLLSLSSGLVNSVDVKPKEPYSLLKPILEDSDHAEIIDQKGNLSIASRLINYSKIKVIMEGYSLTATSKESIRDLKDKFQNKLVIIGDGNVGGAVDKFVIPGSIEAVPGVYLHASAVYTQSVEPFYELKHISKIVIDVFLGLFILIVITVIRWKDVSGNINLEKTQKRFIWFAIAFCLILGIVAVRLLSILWLDFFLVVFALFLHPTVEKGIFNILNIDNN